MSEPSMSPLQAGIWQFLLDRFTGIVEIAEYLGHASLSNTQKYVHLSLTDVIGACDKAHPRA